MKTTVSELEGNKVKVSVEVDEAEFDQALDRAFRSIARQVRIPGFRPGKVPRPVLEARLGAEAAREEALRLALPDYYAQAVAEHDIDVIAAPEIDITAGQDEGPLTFDAVVEVRPRVVVGGYNGLRVTVPDPWPTDDEVDAQLERMRSAAAVLEPADRPAVDGDVVSIDVTGSAGGETIPGLTADDYSYEVGSGGVVPGFDEELRGSSVGDVLAFEAPHPTDPEQGPLSFRILVKAVSARRLPDADDEWAAEASEFATLAELRDDLTRRLGLIKAASARAGLPDRVAEALALLVDDDPPETLVDSELQTRLQDLAARLSSQGLSVEDYLAANQTTGAELTERLRAMAARAVQVDLALRAVAEAEEIEVADVEVDAEVERLAELLEEKPGALRRRLEREGRVPAVRSELRQRKAMEWLVEHAELVSETGRPIDRQAFDLPSGEDASGPEASDDGGAGEPGGDGPDEETSE